MGKRCRKRFESGKPKHGGKSSSGLEPLWIHGRHAALAALANPERVVARAVVQSGDGDLEGLVEEAGRKSGRRRPKPEFKDRRIGRLIGPDARHQGIAVLVEPLEFMAIEDLVRQAERRERALVVILDRATDPGNVGAVLRSAAAFGAMAVIVQERHSPRETGVMAKAASGAAEILPLIRATNIARALERLKNGVFGPWDWISARNPTWIKWTSAANAPWCSAPRGRDCGDWFETLAIAWRKFRFQRRWKASTFQTPWR